MDLERIKLEPRILLLVHAQVERLLAARKALRGVGFRVVAVPTAREALDYLKHHGPADLAVLGLRSEKNHSLLKSIRRLRPRLGVLLLDDPRFGSLGFYDMDGLIAEVYKRMYTSR